MGKRTSRVIRETWLGSQGEDMDDREWKRAVELCSTLTISGFSKLNRQL